MQVSSLVVFFLFLVMSAQTFAQDKGERGVAIFAGGCFWCMEPPFDKLDGVISTTSGYIGGSARTANYKQVSSGATAHVEAVKVEYDPAKIDYRRLLDVYWRNVDPFDNRGQFCDKGSQYLSYIYYGNEKEKVLAEQSLAGVEQKFNTAVATKVIAATAFYPAESYHQDYYRRNPIRYKFYRNGCGRDRRLQEIWGAK